jgi:esterase/lipase superfamily enzyme
MVAVKGSLVPFFLACFALLLFHCPQALAADEAEDGKIAKFINVPLFYVTDRDKEANDFNGRRKAEHDFIYQLNCGTGNCVLINTDHKTIGAEEEKLGWSSAKKLGTNPISLSPIAGLAHEDHLSAAFTQSFISAITASGHKEFFVFIHGANTTFDDSVQEAAMLSYTTERPVILFSWPSVGKFLSYTTDTGNNEWSQEHFNRFIEDLIQLEAQNGFSGNLVAHSMGNRLVVRAAPIMCGQHVFKQLYLVDPDYDAQTFVHYAARYVQKEDGASTTKLMFSTRDRVLRLAQLFYGGYSRLGQGMDSILGTILDPNAFPEFWQQAMGFLKPEDTGVPVKPREIVPTIANGFETIDYTLADHGIWGHSIPFDLIANLSASGQPGKGLTLVPVGRANSNRLTRFMTWHQDKQKQMESFIRSQKVVSDACDTASAKDKVAAGGAIK